MVPYANGTALLRADLKSETISVIGQGRRQRRGVSLLRSSNMEPQHMNEQDSEEFEQVARKPTFPVLVHVLSKYM